VLIVIGVLAIAALAGFLVFHRKGNAAKSSH
jgi:hypothetical protein